MKEYDLRYYSSSELSKENILARCSQYEIFCKFYGAELKPRKLYLSPFRKEKKRNKDFNIYKTAEAWRFVDFGGHGYKGNAFDFVMFLHKCDFATSLKIINDKMNLGLGTNSNEKLPERIIEFIEPVIEDVESKIFIWTETEWEQSDFDFWKQWTITESILKLFEVKCILFYSGGTESRTYSNFRKKNEPIYGYPMNGNIRFYRPLSKDNRFSGTKSRDDVFGLLQAMESVNYRCFIVGGEKDVMSMTANGFTAVTFNSETSEPGIEFINLLKSKFDELIFLYDNDMTGWVSSLKWADLFECKAAFLPIDIVKIGGDVSVLFKEKGSTVGKEIIKSIVY